MKNFRVGMACTAILLGEIILLSSCGYGGKNISLDDRPAMSIVMDSIGDSSIINDCFAKEYSTLFTDEGPVKIPLLEGLDMLEDDIRVLQLTEKLPLDGIELKDDSINYVVQNGDSFYSISESTGVSMERIAAVNHKEITDTIYPGDTLLISPKFPEYTPEDVETMIEMYENVETPRAEKNEILSTLARVRNDSLEFYDDYAASYLERAGIIVVKGVALDGFSLGVDAYETTKIYNNLTNISYTNDKGKQKHYSVTVGGKASEVLDNVLFIQRGEKVTLDKAIEMIDDIKEASGRTHKVSLFKSYIKENN